MNVPLLLAGAAALVLAALVLGRAADARAERAAWAALAATARTDRGSYDPAMVAGLPEPARRYFAFMIRPGTAIRTVARIEMQGTLGLGSSERPGYRPMRARQILAMPEGFVWRLSAPFAGSDGFTAAVSWTRFRILGLIPVVRVAGDADHHRSAFGRVVAEGAFWTPAAFLPGPGIRWEAVDAHTARAIVSHAGHEQPVEITVAEDGRPLRVVIPRWSNANPDRAWRLQPFGGTLSDFRDFGGYRLPTRVEGGNLIGTDAYFAFYRAEVTDIRFDDLGGG